MIGTTTSDCRSSSKRRSKRERRKKRRREEKARERQRRRREEKRLGRERGRRRKKVSVRQHHVPPYKSVIVSLLGCYDIAAMSCDSVAISHDFVAVSHDLVPSPSFLPQRRFRRRLQSLRRALPRRRGSRRSADSLLTLLYRRTVGSLSTGHPETRTP